MNQLRSSHGVMPHSDSKDLLILLKVPAFDSSFHFVICFGYHASDCVWMNAGLLPAVLVDLLRRIQREELNTCIWEQVGNSLFCVAQRIVLV